MVAYIYNYSRNTVKSNRIKSCVFLFILFNQEICRRISRKDGMAMSNIFPVVITAQHNLCKIFAYKSKWQTPFDAVFSRSDYNNIVITCWHIWKRIVTKRKKKVQIHHILYRRCPVIAELYFIQLQNTNCMHRNNNGIFAWKYFVDFRKNIQQI